MTSCYVLRCHSAGQHRISGTRWLNQARDVIVCSEHKQQIDEGALWDVHDYGKVLMGQDMPPVLSTWSVQDSAGTEGFTLTMVSSTENAKPIEVFITPSNARLLHAMLQSRLEE